MKAVVLSMLALLAVGCDVDKTSATGAPEGKKPSASSAQPAAATAKSSDGASFGEKLSDATPFVALADIYKDPKAYEGKRVRTRGQVVAVCQAAGCWADLRPEVDPNDLAAGGVPTHVTMHGHAFFLPKDAKSKVAEIEGTLAVRALSQTEVDHYNSEGASLTAGTPMINVDAVGLVLR